MALLLLLAAFAYVAGSINFPILLFRLLGRKDPRLAHSNNPGATNVYRQAGAFWAAVVLLLDMGRAFGVGYAAVSLLDSSHVTWVGLALILGNRFPCFHGFKGGKGVANYLGFTLAISPLAAVISGLAWAATFYSLHVPFLASFAMVSVLMLGNIASLGFQVSAVTGTAATVALIVFSHSRNMIERWGGRT